MVDKGVSFSSDALIEISDFCDNKALEKAVLESSKKFKNADLENLYGNIPDEIIIKAARKRRISLPEGLCEYPPIENKRTRRKIMYEYSPSECLALVLLLV